MYIENADENRLSIFSAFVEEQIENEQLLLIALKKAQLQVESGQTITHEKVMSETRNRFPKYFKD